MTNRPYVNIEQDFAPAAQIFMLYLGPSRFEPLRYRVVDTGAPGQPDDQNYFTTTVTVDSRSRRTPFGSFSRRPIKLGPIKTDYVSGKADVSPHQPDSASKSFPSVCPTSDTTRSGMEATLLSAAENRLS